MTGTAITVDDEKVQKLLGKIYDQSGDLSPVLKPIGELVRTSVVRNFEAGGRPEKWAPLSTVTLSRRKKSGGILRVQGHAGGLLGSIHSEAGSDKVVVGTNKIYAAVHQFGAKKGQFGRAAVARKTGRAGRSGAAIYSRGWMMPIPWGDIPARPFMLVQVEDLVEIREMLTEYVLEGGDA